MKSVEIVLRRRGGEKGRMIEEVSLTTIYCKHIGKYHSVSPTQLLYASKIMKSNKNKDL
jgi:hypothetical protein